MKHRECCRLIALVVLFMICENAYAIDDEDSRNSLRELNGIAIIVEHLNEEVVGEGLTEIFIRAPVMVQLHKAGIRVLLIEQWSKDLNIPHLYINANVVKMPMEGYIYNITVELRQRVTLRRSPSILCSAGTWSAACLGKTAELGDIQKTIQEAVAKFVTAYLSVNPKKGPQKESTN